MTYSTAKATVIAEAAALNVTMEKVVEIRDASDLETAVGLKGDDEGEGDSAAAGELKHNLVHAKPARPGKGKARLIKKDNAV